MISFLRKFIRRTSFVNKDKIRNFFSSKTSKSRRFLFLLWGYVSRKQVGNLCFVGYRNHIEHSVLHTEVNQFQICNQENVGAIEGFCKNSI